MKKKIIRCGIVVAILVTNSICFVDVSKANEINGQSSNKSFFVENNYKNSFYGEVTENKKVDIKDKKKRDNEKKLNSKKRNKLISLSSRINKLNREILTQYKKGNYDKVNSYQQELGKLQEIRDLIRSQNK